MAAHVLLLEDDPAIARTVAYTLGRDGMAVTHSLLMHDARQQLQARTFDLLVLDVGLPDGSGLDLLQDLRKGAVHRPGATATPVLVLSARGEELDRVLGLELGADDYLTKPFSPRELAARIKALLRRAAVPMGVVASAGSAHSGFHDDTAGQRISLHGQPLALTRREYRLLACLLHGAGRIHGRETLLATAWGNDSESTDRTVDTHIKTLRAKLRELDPTREYISTHRGMGYCLDA